MTVCDHDIIERAHNRKELREKIEIVEEWLSLVDTFTAQHYSRVRHVPICQGEIDALVVILSLIQSERGEA